MKLYIGMTKSLNATCVEGAAMTVISPVTKI